MLVIDSEECIDCGACEPECPVEAIYPEDAVPDKWEPFIRINYAYPEGMESVNELVQELDHPEPPPPIADYRS
jgi:ferredoxin